MPDQEDIANQQELLSAYRRTLAQLLKQQALISELFTPPAIAHGIEDARANIAHVKQTLRTWGVQVEDLPNDEEPPVQLPAAAKPIAALRTRRARRIALLLFALLVLGAIGAATTVLLPRVRTQHSVLQSVLYWSQCGASPVWVLPGTILPAQDLDKAREQFAQAIATQIIDTWQVAGVDVEAIVYGAQPPSQRKLFMTVRGAGAGKTDIHLFNRASVIVTTTPSPQHVDLVTFNTTNILDCPSGGGGGANRTFPPTNLTQQVRQYTADQQYTEQDYLPLNSESSEVLVFPFECRSPGVYTVQIGLRFRDNLRSTSGTYPSEDLATIVCPASFTFWPITYSPNRGGSNKPEVQFGRPSEYVWNGTTYQEGRS